jgi:hypothetical protein
MYKLLEEFGSNQLGVACAIAGEHSSYGAEYLVSLLAPPRVINVAKTLEIDAPPQSEIDRQLEIYESFVVGSRG